jgi:hypothetical protein
MTITLITPPGHGGVRDFADKLVENTATSQATTVFTWQQGTEHTPVEKALSSDCVYLQYSGYGYAKRGAPLWLLKQLEIHRPQIKTLGIYFHELYAFGPPWGSAFWLSPLQRHITQRLAELSDFWVTNREESAEWLSRFAGEKPYATLPVFSNVGEIPYYSIQRSQKVVVFGGAALRLKTYQETGDKLFIWARQQGLEIHDIGPIITDPLLANRLAAESVVVHGRLPEIEVSSLLADAMFGLVVYPTEFVAKSGVFAAYCAHGVCPVLISKLYPETDGLIPNQHYLAGLLEKLNLFPTANTIGQSAWQWYQLHNVTVHMQTLQKLTLRNYLCL